jgi:DNA modification methylase
MIDLRFGDCMQVMRSIADTSVDAVITDPPYGNTKAAWDSRIDWPSWWTEIHRVCKPAATMVLFAVQPLATDIIISNRTAFRYDLIWDKQATSGFLNSHRRPMTAHELMLVFRRVTRGATYNIERPYGPQLRQVRGSATSSLYGKHASRVHDKTSNVHFARSIFTYRRSVQDRAYHPAAKPSALIRRLLEMYTNVGDLVLDPFMGAGTGGVACAELQRSFIGIENYQVFYDRACDRNSAAEGVLL